jgi:hypothetical protein
MRRRGVSTSLRISHDSYWPARVADRSKTRRRAARNEPLLPAAAAHSRGKPRSGTIRGSRPEAVPGASQYRHREPERSLLYETVRAHWKTLLAEIAERTDGGSLPGFVVAEFALHARARPGVDHADA